MVLVHVKQSEDRQFLYECPSSQSVDTLIRDVVLINNLQLRLLILAREGEQLCLHGPARAPNDDGDPDSDDDANYDSQKAECSSSASYRRQHGPFYLRDPSGKRTGEACDPEVAKTLRKTLAEAEACVSKEQVMHKMTLNANILKEALQNVRGAVMMCYPMGLPDFDPVHQLLNGTFNDGDLLDPDSAQMWWAGKELLREKKLCDHVGKNEKTKFIAKLQSRGRAPPPREPPVDSETQKAMAAWYYKQQQEQKKLDEDDDDSYTNSQWSNPKALKCHFQGTSCIRYR
ncbi:hypothetical protein KP509_25G015400 [Ceratopteris richardii]|uniref:Uncharacterized protein n=1 Tax=Ceratopteris richardii TaxID=49495 RepID=A0A8T2RQA2_CERRI|nr:hypothetical protein KP509_25G015400 [Ceratopteris richardii]